jgi:predicted  nucleic acid-binding Zn-ribbon protein
MFDVLDLPFDQYQRYGLVSALLESVRAPGGSFRVLDVGGRTGLLRKFLPADTVELVDVVPSDIEGLILGSGAKLPFKDNAFDVVAAFDTLEHVPPDLRGAFVSECGRVAKHYVMLAGPYDNPRVAEAEQHLLDFLKVRLNWEHRYLAEHRENGLPDAVQTRSILRAIPGARVESFGHGALDRWLLLMMLELYVEHEGLLHGIAPKLYRFYNQHLFRSDHGAEVYRHAIVAAYGDAPMPTLEGVLDPPGSAPREATQAMVDMGAEILRYDSLRDTYLPEMERMHAQVSAANKNAEEHRASMQTFADDLEQHRLTIEALRAELSDERKGVEAVIEDRDLQLNGFKARVEEQEGLVTNLTALREAESKELEARGAALQEANEALVRQNEEAVRVNEEMVHLNEEIARVNGLATKLGEDIKGLAGNLSAATEQRDEARRMLTEERARADALAESARSFTGKVLRKLKIQKLSPDLLERRGGIEFDSDPE